MTYNNKYYTSNCGEVTVRGKAKDIVPKYEGYGYGAEREKLYREAHNFFQHAEHYKKLTRDSYE